MPVFVTKEDSQEAQSVEASVYGGQNPRGGMAAQMQVRTQKTPYAGFAMLIRMTRVQPIRSNMRDVGAIAAVVVELRLSSLWT